MRISYLSESTESLRGLWLAERVTEGEVLEHWRAWADYRDWAFVRRRRVGKEGLGAALVAAGGRRRLRPLRYEGLTLREAADSGYRATTFRTEEWAPAQEVAPDGVHEAFTNLYKGGLVTDRRALDMAEADLLDLDTTPCSRCGLGTRRPEGRHVGC